MLHIRPWVVHREHGHVPAIVERCDHLGDNDQPRERVGETIEVPAARTRSWRNWTLSFAVILASSAWGQYQSNDPSDATLPLTYTLNAGGETILCTAGSETTGGTLSAATNTPIAIVPAVLCGNVAASPADVWYRIDVPAGDNRFRITVKDGATNPLTNGAMAVYSAPSALGPFEMIDCAVGGNPSNTANPSLEVACIPGGSKLYIRIWEEGASSSTKNFSVCIQGQNWLDAGTRQNIGDTPCSPTALTVGGALTTYYNTFACTESFPMEPSCGGYKGGDIWFTATVPAQGGLRLAGALATARMLRRVSFAVYLAPATATCTDVQQFTEVACFSTTFISTTQATIGEVRCLTPNATAYIRVFVPSAAQNDPLRYGSFQFRVQNPGASWGVAPNNVPCQATTLTIGACPAFTSGLATTNVNTCGFITPGIPDPGCGSISANTRDVWYKFTAPANGTVGINVNGDNSSAPAFDAAAALYSAGPGGCSGPLTLIECDANHGPGLGAYIVRTGLVPGQTYYLRVWGEGTGGTQQGIMYVCITNPIPTPGSCFYVITMSHELGTGVQSMQRIIGTDTVTYTTTMNDPSQVFLIEIPAGSNVHFYWNSALASITGSGQWTSFSAGQLGEIPTWASSTGGPVHGPTSPPVPHYYTVSCTTIIPAREDCLGSRTICGPTFVADTTELTDRLSFFGYTPDLNAQNRGCLSIEQRAGRWLVFRARADGKVSFTLQSVHYPTTDNMDFAIWDTGLQPTGILPNVTPSVCSPNGPPIRCSSSTLSGTTGLRANIHNRFSEGAEGYGWLSPLDVLQDHVYLLYVVNNNLPEWGLGAGPYPPPGGYSTIRPFTLGWTQLLNAAGTPDNTILDCDRLILPVVLLGIEAEPVGGDVLVSWSTGSEKDSDHFVVERSANGIDFSTIGIVPGAGHSQSRRDYMELDEDPYHGMNYYRLRMVDTDGSFTYSSVVAVQVNVVGRAEIFPNPGRDRIFVNLSSMEDTPLLVGIHDATGRLVQEQTMAKADNYGFELNIAGLTEGSYFVRITAGSGRTSTGRFVKQ